MKYSIAILLLVISNISFGQLKLEDLQIDTTITGFHLAAEIYVREGEEVILYVFRNEGIIYKRLEY